MEKPPKFNTDNANAIIDRESHKYRQINERKPRRERHEFWQFCPKPKRFLRFARAGDRVRKGCPKIPLKKHKIRRRNRYAHQPFGDLGSGNTTTLGNPVPSMHPPPEEGEIDTNDDGTPKLERHLQEFAVASDDPLTKRELATLELEMLKGGAKGQRLTELTERLVNLVETYASSSSVVEGDGDGEDEGVGVRTEDVAPTRREAETQPESDEDDEEARAELKVNARNALAYLESDEFTELRTKEKREIVEKVVANLGIVIEGRLALGRVKKELRNIFSD